MKCVSKSMKIFSKIEQEKLCQYLCSEYNQHNIGILIYLFTRLRIREIIVLNWEDVSFSSKTFMYIALCKKYKAIQILKKNKITSTEPKSSCSIRTISIPKTLLSILTFYKNKDTGYLLINNDTKFIASKSLQSKFKWVWKKSEINHANLHALRHPYVNDKKYNSEKQKTQTTNYFDSLGFLFSFNPLSLTMLNINISASQKSS